MPGEPGIHVVASKELRALAAKLRKENTKWPTELRKELRKAATGAAKEAKQAARRLPATGRRSTGLRRRIARGVGVQASTQSGIRIVTRMPAGQEMLPRGMDRAEGWRHPVFGDRDVWVTQPGYSWFREPIAQEHPEVQSRIKTVMDDFARRVTR